MVAFWPILGDAQSCGRRAGTSWAFISHRPLHACPSQIENLVGIGSNPSGSSSTLFKVQQFLLNALWLPAAHTLYERRQLDLCVGRAAPVTPHHGATGSSCGKPSKRCAAASGPRTHALSALSCALTRCGASLCGHRYLYVSCRARSRPRPDRPRHGHRRRCRRRRRRRRHSPRVRLMRLCSSRHYLRVRTCDGHVV